MYYGDSPTPVFWSSSDWTKFVEMPTAIVRVYTSEGFVVAADGLSRAAETGAIVSSTEQKLFCVSQPSRFFVYAFMGTPKIMDDSTGDTVLDLVNEMRIAIQGRFQSPSRLDFSWYVSKLWPDAHKRLKEAIKNKNVGPFPDEKSDPGLICYVFFFGYYRGVPIDASLRFAHDNQKVLKPTVYVTPHLSQGTQTYGSRIVASALFDPLDPLGPRFSAFRTPSMDRSKRSLTLAEGIEIAENYIRACDSDAGREADPTICPGIGGHIHIAGVRPSGAEWIRRPQAGPDVRPDLQSA